MAAGASLAIIGAGMILMNDRVHDQARRLAAGDGPSAEVTSSVHHFQRAVLLALDALRDQSIDHAPLTIFALAATILLLVMLRT